MRQVILAAISGAALAFIWGMVSWVALPFHTMAYKDMPNEDMIAQVFRENLTEPGVYHYPGFGEESMDTDASEQAWMDKYAKGPVITMLVYSPTGGDVQDWHFMVRGFLINLSAALILCFVIWKARASFPTVGSRMLLGLMFALFAGLMGPAQDMNWNMMPATYALTMAMDYIIAWVLVGFVAGKIIK